MSDRITTPRTPITALVVVAVLVSASSAQAAPPLVDLGGAALAKQWLAGSPAVTVGGRVADHRTALLDSIEATLDGEVFAYQTYTGSRPSAAALFEFLPTTRVADGRHTLTVKVVDSNGEIGVRSVAINVDNHAPAAPFGVSVDSGTGWRADQSRTARWAAPTQQFAPLAGLRWRLCPAEADSADPRIAAQARASCTAGELGVDALARSSSAFMLPRPGLWTLRLWLVDAAGNASEETAARVIDLGYDPTPPQVVGFAPQQPADPARVAVGASDDVAPLAEGAIEIRRRGANAWRPLPTEVGRNGLSAVVDDETLHKGRYALRATVINAAGLQQGTDRRADGEAKTLRLPIRLASRLEVGRRVGRVCRGMGEKRDCRARLSRRVAVPLGRRVAARGRLTVAGKPVGRQPLEVWQRLSVEGAAWERIATVTTNARGRLRYIAASGPARRLRFRYTGTPLIRGANADVALRVQAKTTLSVSRQDVINGEYVMFRGNLKGQPWPAAGVLVELQVRSRGKWRTFAQPRANPASGAWRYQYRFETVDGAATFRFRGRVRRQAGYPYVTGASKAISVRVHGL